MMSFKKIFMLGVSIILVILAVTVLPEYLAGRELALSVLILTVLVCKIQDVFSEKK